MRMVMMMTMMRMMSMMLRMMVTKNNNCNGVVCVVRPFVRVPKSGRVEVGSPVLLAV